MATANRKFRRRLLKFGLAAGVLTIPAAALAACSSPASYKYMTLVAQFGGMDVFNDAPATGSGQTPAYLQETKIAESGVAADTLSFSYLQNQAKGTDAVSSMYDVNAKSALATTTTAGNSFNNLYATVAKTLATTLIAPAVSYAAAADDQYLTKDGNKLNPTTAMIPFADGGQDALADFYRAAANNLLVANEANSTGFALTDLTFSYAPIDPNGGSSGGTDANADQSPTFAADATAPDKTQTDGEGYVTQLGQTFDARIGFTPKTLQTGVTSHVTVDQTDAKNPKFAFTDADGQAKDYTAADFGNWYTKTYLITDATATFRFFVAGPDKGEKYPGRGTIVQNAAGETDVNDRWSAAYGAKAPAAYAFALTLQPLVTVVSYAFNGDASAADPAWSLQPTGVLGFYPADLLTQLGYGADLVKKTADVNALMTPDEYGTFTNTLTAARTDFTAFTGALGISSLRAAQQETAGASGHVPASDSDLGDAWTMRKWFGEYFSGLTADTASKPFTDYNPDQSIYDPA